MSNLELGKLNSSPSQTLTDKETKHVIGGFSIFGSNDDESVFNNTERVIEGSFNDSVDSSGGIVTGSIITDPGSVSIS
ncbi:MAG: hypothetical protein AAF383_27230 [Cyanobacteria bacterium P01_A01_bin.83]